MSTTLISSRSFWSVVTLHIEATWRPQIIFSFFSFFSTKHYSLAFASHTTDTLSLLSTLLVHIFTARFLKSNFTSLIYFSIDWTEYLSRYSDWLRAGRSGDRIPVGARFFAHVQTGFRAHPASCTMGTGSLPGVKRPGRGADYQPPSNAEVESE
jgi:hypothetical protein